MTEHEFHTKVEAALKRQLEAHAELTRVQRAIIVERVVQKGDKLYDADFVKGSSFSAQPGPHYIAHIRLPVFWYCPISSDHDLLNDPNFDVAIEDALFDLDILGNLSGTGRFDQAYSDALKEVDRKESKPPKTPTGPSLRFSESGPV